MEDLVSIVVPVYNVEKYLKKSIESILNQTYDNLEVLLVDDGSTDSSGEICDSFIKVDSRIRVFHKENGGLSDARNFGIEHMKANMYRLLMAMIIYLRIMCGSCIIL
ncbi:ss-1,4-galactosyltransferase [Streptococcus pneumoniae]|nr:ss-1,4-galactosyltransferase [Streptococcus pneumoniae]